MVYLLRNIESSTPHPRLDCSRSPHKLVGCHHCFDGTLPFAEFESKRSSLLAIIVASPSFETTSSFVFNLAIRSPLSMKQRLCKTNGAYDSRRKKITLCRISNVLLSNIFNDKCNSHSFRSVKAPWPYLTSRRTVMRKGIMSNSPTIPLCTSSSTPASAEAIAIELRNRN